jgi:hypothetical protein
MAWVCQVMRMAEESDPGHFSRGEPFENWSSHNRCEKRFDFRVNWRSSCHKKGESRSHARPKVVSEIFEHKQIIEKVETAPLLHTTQFVIDRAFDPPLFLRPHLFDIRFYGLIQMIPEPRLAKHHHRLCELQIIQQLFMVNIPAFGRAVQHVLAHRTGTHP